LRSDLQVIREAVLEAIRDEQAVPNVVINRQTKRSQERAIEAALAFGAGTGAGGAESLTNEDGEPYFMLDHSALDGDDVLE